MMTLTENKLRNIIINEVRKALKENVNARAVKEEIENAVNDLMNGYESEPEVIFGNNVGETFTCYLKDYDEENDIATMGVDYMGRTATAQARGIDNKKALCRAVYDAFMIAYLNLPDR